MECENSGEGGGRGGDNLNCSARERGRFRPAINSTWLRETSICEVRLSAVERIVPNVI